MEPRAGGRAYPAELAECQSRRPQRGQGQLLHSQSRRELLQEHNHAEASEWADTTGLP